MSLRAVYVFLLGCFLGLAWVKFGNPVVLDAKLDAPQTWDQLLSWPWPLRWAFAAFLPVAIAGFALSQPMAVLRTSDPSRSGSRGWLLGLPLAWLGWQLLSSQYSVDPALTRLVLPHFAAGIAAYFLGYFLLRDRTVSVWLWPGLLAALVYCLVRASNQYAVEFPQSLAQYREGDRLGWTNATPMASYK